MPALRSDEVRLTARQRQLLQHCIKRGYYGIPRGLTLRQLGAELSISATSLSLALRRAEAKIILAFAQEGVSAHSDGHVDRKNGDGIAA